MLVYCCHSKEHCNKSYMFVWDLPHYIMQHYFLLTPLVHIADILVLLMLETKKYKYKVAFEW